MGLKKKEVIIEVDIESGDVNIDAKGFIGDECILATKPFEDALGKVVKEKKKMEYYKQSEKSKRRLKW